jgi:choline dehydrogenase-like flavoprotein
MPTPFGQLPFCIDYLKQAGRFDAWVADCPLRLPSPNAPRKRNLLGTMLLSVLTDHRRYAHITALRCDPMNPPLLGMKMVVSEDAVRRGLKKMNEEQGSGRPQNHLEYCTTPLLGESMLIDRIRRRVQGDWHARGTYCMSAPDDRGAVVDPEGRVYGVENLRVVDASVVPSVLCANTNISTIMIGEKMADPIHRARSA